MKDAPHYCHPRDGAVWHGAPDAVDVADLDAFDYFVIALRSARGPYASYSSGRLPFDRVNDQVYELGFQFRF